MSLLDDLTPAERAEAERRVVEVRRGMAAEVNAQSLAFGEHDALDAELARIQADADVRMAEVRGRAAAGPLIEGPRTVDELRAEQTEAEVEDFTAFWTGRGKVGKTLRNVHGIDLTLPAELPLRFEIEARRLQRDQSAAAVSHLFGLLYGQAAYLALFEKGITPGEFTTLLMWGIANASGKDMTLSQAADAYEDAKAKSAQGKAVVPPSGTGGTSSAFGPSSKPTSHANTQKKARKKRSRR